ncbi:MAG: hypothetical protein R3301_06790 [Saprospiraceae bacterium]|nr:hypothetical protein [Saprospiraceae bacterium]
MRHLLRTGLLLLCPLTLLLPQTPQAQDNPRTFQTAERTFVRKLGQTKPLREVLAAGPTAEQKLFEYKSNKPTYVRNFIGRRPTETLLPGALPRGIDPLVMQSTMRDGGLRVLPQVVAEGMGINDSGSGVPDVNGDVNHQYYIETVNSTWLQVFDLQGNKVGDQFHANTIWQQVGFSSAGDPIILWDHEAGRWFLTEFPPSSRVLMAVSDTEDPFGSWTAYVFTTPSFPDYPKYSIWPEAYVLTTNEGGGGSVKFYVINREDILNGADTVDMQRFTVPRISGPGFQVLTPVGWIGDSLPPAGMDPMVMRMNDDAWGAPQDRIEIYSIDVDWDDEANSVVTETLIPTAPFDAEFCSESGPGFTCVPQPNGVGIDGIPWVIMHRMKYRRFATHSALVLNFTVDVSGDDDAGIRWIELRADSLDWEVYQEGTIGSLDGENRFMGGISIDALGNIGLGYNVSSETTWPSLRFTGRRATDPLGEMTFEEYEFATGTGGVNGDRFGDYASMSVDDQNMFWYAGEYVVSGPEWRTKIVGFKLTREQVDIGPVGLVEPANAPDLEEEMVTVEIINHGITPQTDFDIGYVFNGGAPVIETVSVDTLFTDSVYVHTFAQPVLFDGFGDYPLMVFTSMAADSFQINDTCRFTVTKQTRFDAQALGVKGLTNTVCDTFAELELVIQNAGVETLTSATVAWSVNGAAPETEAWTGSLGPGETDVIPILLDALLMGVNNVRFTTTAPNGMADQNPLNDTLDFVVNTTAGGDLVTLNLLTDNFPAETSWVLQDSAGVVLFASPAYAEQQTEHIEQWCLDPAQCYRFILFDSYGDGIQAFGVEGDFQIINAEGFVVASLGEANFGDADTTDFCLDFTCMLVASPFISHESRPGANNGLISLAVNGGVAPFQFSKDGGQSFQSSPIFTGLAPGIYEMLVLDASGCTVELTIAILACDIQLMTEVTSTTGEDVDDGSILINAQGGNGPLTYSIDGGATSQNDPFFGDLADTSYIVVVEDSVGCEVRDTVVVDVASSVEYTTYGHLIRAFPNPSEGEFYFEIDGVRDLFVNWEVIDGNGRIVERGEAGSFSGVIKGQVRLLNHPPGMYYLRFRHKQLDRLTRLVKL